MEHLHENNFWLATIVTIVACLQWLTLERQRKKDLFDKRYKFYKNIQNIYLSLEEKHKNGGNPYLEAEDIFPYITEAKWLFGNDVAEALNNLIGKELDGTDQIFRSLPENINEVFDKYMQIEAHNYLWNIKRKVKHLYFLILFNKNKS